jgi:arginyl-tRNA synthetase
MPVLCDLIQKQLHLAVTLAQQAGALGALTQIPEITHILVEKPKNSDHGDYATPLALSLAKLAKLSPRVLAEKITQYADATNFTWSVAGPGFINVKVSDGMLNQGLQNIFLQGADFGRTVPPKAEKILLEFVSANPTGPLHVGHGRWAALGSALGNLLEFAGHQVEKEFYINDAGNQMRKLGESLRTRYLQKLDIAVADKQELELFRFTMENLNDPNNPYIKRLIDKEEERLGYQGIAIEKLADEMLVNFPFEVLETGDVPFENAEQMISWCTEYAYQQILAQQADILGQFKTTFDTWFSERTLHTGSPSAIEAGVMALEERGYLYRGTGKAEGEESKEIATFFRTTDFGDDKDRVLVRSDGRYTYMAADIAYHKNKLDRGFDRLINILGADHHGYVARLKAIVQAFGKEADTLEIMIGQLVKLYRLNPITQKKEEVKMSKRTGTGVTVDDLLFGIDSPEDAIGADAARWYLLSQSPDSQITFDLDLAVQQTADNLVFYAQYAHARTCSLDRLLMVDKGAILPEHFSFVDAAENFLLTQPEARALILTLLKAPEQFRFAAVERAPHKVVSYTAELASHFHKFYDACRIAPILTENPPLAYAWWGLARATRQVLANSLGLLGITAPTAM